VAEPADTQPDTDPAPVKGKETDAQIKASWERELSRYNKAFEPWLRKADKLVKIYLNEDRAENTTKRAFAMLWSNVETLKPAIYVKLPVVNCSRRYKDPDPTGRTASEMLERTTNCGFELYDAHEVFEQVRDDRLIPGRGQAWARYEADIEYGAPDEKTKAPTPEKLKGEKFCVDYVHYSDFGHNTARIWRDVWLVWRRVYKDRQEATDTWGAEKADKLVYNARDPGDKDATQEADKAVIFEFWDKKRDKVGWVAKDSKEPGALLAIGEPPFRFVNFFPCPKPFYASKTSKSLVPTPDYDYYKDQANEIDDLTARIAGLTDWLVLKGFVPAGPSTEGAAGVKTMIEVLQSRITEAGSILIPIESWAGFTEKGGASKLIDWVPLDIVIQTLQAAVETRQQLIQDIYQITGISDISRGDTDPNETATAQQIKAQTGTRRVRTTKDEMARFTKDVASLCAEIAAKQFQPQTLADMTGMKYVPAPQQIAPAMMPGMPQQGMPQQPGMQPQQQMPEMSTSLTFDDKVMQLLRDDRMRGFRIDIETDSTIQPDEDLEKQRRVEFGEVLGGMMKSAAETLPAAPDLAPIFAEGLKFMSRGFRVGRQMEDVIERTMDAWAQKMMQPKEPPPDPKMEAVKAKAAADQAKLQQEGQIAQQELAQEAQIEGAKLKQEMEINAAEAAQEAEIARMNATLDAAIKRQTAEANIQTTQMKADASIEQSAIAAKAKAKAAKTNGAGKNGSR